MNYEHFITDGATQASTTLARSGWGGPEMILGVHRVQQQLAEHLADGINPLDEVVALCIIERMGEAFDNNADGERATVALGEVLVAAARLAAHNELAILPVLDLARVFTHRGDVLPISAPSRLARAVNECAREGNHGIGALTNLVGALALCIAKTLDDVEILHDVRVKPDELLVAYGTEVLQKHAARVTEAEQASGQGR